MNFVDLLLAVLHHLLVFSLAAIIAAEAVLVGRDMPPGTLKRLAGIDRSYGIAAALIIVVGICRVIFGLKGWEFYVYNPVFWAKMGAFVGVALLSIRPTIRFIQWDRAAAADAAYRVPTAEIDSVRRFIRWEIAIFALIPIFAAAMARGYGL